MKRWFTTILFLMLLACISSPALAGAPESALPQQGDSVHGFTVLSAEPMSVLGATAVLFEHDKSGAQLLYLASEDVNRSFNISFRTPPLDDKGKPHVFEHISLSGSQRYPDANLFFPLSDRTYNTYANATTGNGVTWYSSASLSEEQLMLMMDYYLSGVFEPLLYTEPRLLQREAWRYELTDADAPLSVAGTVYSEMQGLMTPSRLAYTNNLRALYEGGTAAYESGGIPEEIRTLTYEELVEFHKTYYHPSNALITLYGKLDYDQFLAFIDEEYLSGYDRKDIDVDMGHVTPYTETHYATFEAPVEQGAQTEDAGCIYYSFALDGGTLEDLFSADLLTTVLNSESLPFKSEARRLLPNAVVSSGCMFDSPTALISFYAEHVNESDRDTFVSIVDAAISQLAADGIPQETLDSALSSKKMGLLLTRENPNLGVTVSENIALGWGHFGTIDYYTVRERCLESANRDSLGDFLQAALIDNTYRAVSVTKPVAGLSEEKAAALETELAEKKAAMTDAEIEALIADHAAFTEWTSAAPSDEIIDRLCAVTVDSLPEEIQHFDVADTTKDGVRYLTAEAEVEGVGETQIILDASTLPLDSVQDVQTYLVLTGNLRTSAHSREELNTLMTRYLPNILTSLEAFNRFDGEPIYGTSLSWQSLAEDYETSLALMREIVFDMQLDETDTIRFVLNTLRTQINSSLVSVPTDIHLMRIAAMMFDTSAFIDFCCDTKYYDYLGEMLALLDENPAAFVARMEDARSLLMNKSGATVLFAGNADMIKVYEAAIPKFFDGMADEPREKTDYSVLRLTRQDEALINNLNVHTNVILAESHGYTSKDIVAGRLIEDLYLVPILRNIYGAYGTSFIFSSDYDMLYTFRDPNCAQSFDVFAALPEYLRTAEITQEMVDNYIIGAYSELSRPNGVLLGAMETMNWMLSGVTEDMRLGWLREAKATTVDDIRAYADVVENLLETGVRSTSGTAVSLGEDLKLFDAAIRLDDAE